MASTFQEDNGSQSAMRLMCFLSLLMSFFTGGATALSAIAPQPGLTLTAMFLAPAFGAKVGQKFVETKVPK